LRREKRERKREKREKREKVFDDGWDFSTSLLSFLSQLPKREDG